MWEPYPRSKIVNCPICGCEGLLIKRTTDLKLYIMKCETHGEVELTFQKEGEARHEYNKDRKDDLDLLLGSTKLFNKKPKKNLSRTSAR
jgi:hypothetical protein